MQQNPMEDKHLNFNQPLLSVRRGSSATAVAEVERRKPPPTKPPLPYYKSDLKSGPVCNTGVVPFQWERIPGRPKNHRKLRTKAEDQPPPAPKLPPGRAVNTDENLHKNVVELALLEDDKEGNGSSHSEGESTTYLDALDTLSRSESLFLNCSSSGMSGSDCPGGKSFREFSDRQTLDFMMGRFLPAAKAVASKTPQFGTRKQSKEVKEVIISDKKTVQHNYKLKTLAQHCEDFNDEEDVDEAEDYSDGDDDYAGTENVSTKLCGLLPRFCLLSTMRGMREQAPLPLPTVHKAQEKNSDPSIYNYKKSEKAIRDAVFERRRLTVYQRSDMRIHATRLKNEQKIYIKQNMESTNAAVYKEKGFLGPQKSITAFTSVDEHLRIKPADADKNDTEIFMETNLLTEDKESIMETNLLTDGKESIMETNLLLPLPLPKSPSESWLSRTLPSMSSKHLQSKMYPGTRILDLKPTPAEPNRECSSLDSKIISLPALMPISED